MLTIKKYKKISTSKISKTQKKKPNEENKKMKKIKRNEGDDKIEKENKNALRVRSFSMLWIFDWHSTIKEGDFLFIFFVLWLPHFPRLIWIRND